MRRQWISAIAGSVLIGFLATGNFASGADIGSPGSSAMTDPISESSTIGPRGDAYFYVGGLGVTNGYADRWFLGLVGNVYYESGLGLHLDTAYVNREENAGYFAGGISGELSSRVRGKVMGGTSSNNMGILPEVYVRGELEIASAPEKGVLLRPSLTYRSYRNGVNEGTGHIEAVRYFPPSANGTFWIGQLGAAATYSDPGSNIGWELTGGGTYVAPDFGTIGTMLVGGNMAYDSVLGASSVSVGNSFFGVRPFASYYLNDRAELIARGEIITTEFYNLFGGTLGLKVNF